MHVPNEDLIKFAIINLWHIFYWTRYFIELSGQLFNNKETLKMSQGFKILVADQKRMFSFWQKSMLKKLVDSDGPGGQFLFYVYKLERLFWCHGLKYGEK